MRIGEKLRKIREMKGFSQEFIASQLNISPQAFGKIEREETKLDFVRLETIARIMEVDPLDIINFDESQIYNNTFNNHASNQKNFIMHNNEHYNPLIENAIKILQEEVQQLRTSNHLLIQLIEKIAK